MRRPQTLPVDRDETWRTAILLGLATVPFTVFFTWQASDAATTDYSIGPVVVAGLVVGAIYSGTETESRRVGFRTGLVAALPFFWPFVELLASVVGWSQPAWVGIIQGLMMVVFVAFAVVISAVVCAISAMFADWLTGKIHRRRPSVVGS